MLNSKYCRAGGLMAKANGHYQQFGSCNMPVDSDVVPRTSGKPVGRPTDFPIPLTDGRALDLVRRPGH